MGFFQVQLFRAMHADEGSLDPFFVVVDKVKPAPKNVKNAAYILEVDETPVPGCNEIAINATNGARILQYLLRNHKDANPEHLVGCAIQFGFRQYKDFVDPATGEPQIGLAVIEIEPFDLNSGLESMKWDLNPVDEPDPWAAEAPAELTPAQKKRAELKARQAEANKPPATVDAVLTRKAAATKKRK